MDVKKDGAGCCRGKMHTPKKKFRICRTTFLPKQTVEIFGPSLYSVDKSKAEKMADCEEAGNEEKKKSDDR